MASGRRTLIVITGPTASGKSAVALEVASRLGCAVISSDSRQIYKEIPIGTAAPSEDDMAAVPHFFVGTKSILEYYSAACFEEDVLELLPELWSKSDYVVMCGGSMMYVDAVVRGIDVMPTVSDENRRRAMDLYEKEGLEGIRSELKRLDPEYYEVVDLNNHKRIVHAVEIIYEAGCTYTSLRTGRAKPRDFNIVKFAIDMPREVLFDRINRRVDSMLAAGMVEEARRVYHLKHLNSLNTVGYKELFAYFDGKMDYETARLRIGKNTRVYAKKQLTWLKKDESVVWLSPDDAANEIIRRVRLCD